MTQPLPAGPPKRAGSGVIVIVALVSLLVGLGLGALAWSLAGSSNEPGADGNAGFVCDRVAAMDTPIPEDGLALNEPLSWELVAIGQLASAAALRNERYEEFEELGDFLMNGLQGGHIEQVNEGIDDIQAACQDL